MAWGLRQRSKKREAEEELRREVCRKVRRRDRVCQAKAVVPKVYCGGPLDVHEVIPRSAWAKGYLDESNCLLVCRNHHDWIGDHPDDAHDFGLHGYSWEVPEISGL
jgi:hypothetical protein